MKKILLAISIILFTNVVFADAIDDAVRELKKAGCELKENAQNIQKATQSRSRWFQEIYDELAKEKNLSKCDDFLKAESHRYLYVFKDHSKVMQRLGQNFKPICNGSYSSVWSIRKNPKILQKKAEEFQRLLKDFNYQVRRIQKDEKNANGMIEYVKSGC